MTHIEYFKLQAKNLFRDYKTKTLNFDIYEYNPKYFDIDGIILAYDLDEDNFTLMNAQHVISRMVGFRKWTDFLKASEKEQELAKLLFDNQDKISIDDWEMYIANVERDNGDLEFDAESKLEIFKHIIIDGDCKSPFPDYRLNKIGVLSHKM